MRAHIALGKDGGQGGCTGHGRCAIMAGDVYELDDEGYNIARGGSFEISPMQEQSARLGATVCPERAITIED